MIYCVWYPSGGFGHFINAVLTLHGNNFARPLQQGIVLGSTGNSHSLDLVAPKYSKDPDQYNFTFDPDQNYSVLIDNGIDNEGTRFRSVFPDSRVIKLCYSDRTWSVVAKTFIEKAMRSTLEKEIGLESEPWAQRERYFLFLRDNPLRSCWRASPDCFNISIDTMFDYNLLKTVLTAGGINVTDFSHLHREWAVSNSEHIGPMAHSLAVVDAIKNNRDYDLSIFNTIWSQAVLYYFLWLEFGQEVPHNDYSDFFSTVADIRTWLGR